MAEQHTPIKWTRRNTLPMENMLHCWIKDEKGKAMCRVDGYPDEAEAFEARVDLIASAPTLQARIDELEAERAKLTAYLIFEKGSCDQVKELEAEKAELVEACEASLTAFRAMYDKMENEQSAHSAHDVCQELLDEESYWPLSKLRAAIAKHETVETDNHKQESGLIPSFEPLEDDD